MIVRGAGDPPRSERHNVHSIDEHSTDLGLKPIAEHKSTDGQYMPWRDTRQYAWLVVRTAMDHGWDHGGVQ